jgi:peptide/nickel transport system substrate-binding protein
MDRARRTGTDHRLRGRSKLPGHVSRDDAHLRERGVSRRELLTGTAPSRRSTLALTLTLALAYALGGCADASPDGQAAGGDPVAGGTLVVAGPSNLESLNSLVTTDAIVQDILLHVLFVPLVGMDSTLAYVPALAREWELHGDTAVTFRLRDDVRWHDGARTSAYDVAFTFERLKDPATAFPNPEAFDRWRSVEVIDSSTVRFRLEPPLVEPLAGWAQTAVMPEHLLDSVPAEGMRNAGFNRSPVGNGPFRFVSARENDVWVFEANPDFPEELGGAPHLQRLVWRVIPENAAQVTELRTTGAHVILSARAEQLAQLDPLPEFRAIQKPSRRYIAVAWNGRRPPLDDARVRRALALAIDRAEMLQVLRGGYGALGESPVPPHHWAFSDGVAPLGYDTAAAKLLLERAGLRDGDGDGIRERADGSPFAIQLKIPANSPFNRDIAEMIQADLADVGVAATPVPVEFSTLITRDFAPEHRDYDAVVMGMETDFRLDLRSLFHSAEAREGAFQLAGFANPRADALMDSLAVTSDRTRAAPLWSDLQHILRSEQPWTYLWHSPELIVVREEVQGLTMDLRGLFVDASEWYLRR